MYAQEIEKKDIKILTRCYIPFVIPNNSLTCQQVNNSAQGFLILIQISSGQERELWLKVNCKNVEKSLSVSYSYSKHQLTKQRSGMCNTHCICTLYNYMITCMCPIEKCNKSSSKEFPGRELHRMPGVPVTLTPKKFFRISDIQCLT